MAKSSRIYGLFMVVDVTLANSLTRLKAVCPLNLNLW